MLRKMGLMSIFLVGILMCTAAVCFAITLLSQEEALKQVFPSGTTIEKETKELSGETLDRIKERLGGSLVYEQEGSESEHVESTNTVDFYFGVKGGKRIGVAIHDVEPGRWGPVEFMTAMDINATVKAVAVMSYQEQRGQPIARRSFLNQYRGKTSRSPLTVGKDIIGVSGATISSRAATFTVKKAIVLYEEVYLHK